MTTLLEVLQQADARKIAVGHFNVSDLVTLYGIVEAARQRGLPVVVGASGDHTHSLSGALEAAKAGFDWVVCDFSSLPFDDNLRQTKEAVLALKAVRADILVEGEIGNIGSGSQIHDSAPHGPLTTPDEAMQFVQETGIDTLAPAVGNMHGVLKSMVSGGARKHLDIERIRAIKERTRIFMTLHGGSDTADADFLGAIVAGMTVVHINTEIRLAWRRGIEESFAEQKDEIAPYALLAPAVEAVKRVVGTRLALFSGRESRT
jgi:fructose-bisphosphate aldolase class II